VERKISEEQVVERMTKILKDYHQHHQGCGGGKPRCIVYCLTPRLCEEFKQKFELHHGVSAAVFISEQADWKKKHILRKFGDGSIQVICATKALGRGVHIDCPIRFIFHPVMPTSLTGT
jgi:ATP-dependent DNA helicase Q1